MYSLDKMNAILYTNQHIAYLYLKLIYNNF